MGKMNVPLHALFNIFPGNSLDLVVLEETSIRDGSVNYVSRTRENNGVSARVKLLPDVEPFEAGLITVAGSGNSVLESFIQPEPFYTGYHVFVLRPKEKMTASEKLFYCYCIRLNQYKYGFGRQANRTLKNLLVPAEPPTWVSQVPNYEPFDPSPLINERIELDASDWSYFRLSDLFEIERGRGPRLNELTEQEGVPFVTSTDVNNGWSGVAPEPVHNGNVITVARNGSVGEAFYQPVSFASTEDVHVFNPKFPLNPYIALFLVTILKREKYRYNYGRKWGLQRMNETLVKLPATEDGNPDFLLMENYMKSLPFSSSLNDGQATGIRKVAQARNRKTSGLTDSELIEKYESGQAPMKQIMMAMLTTPPPDETKKTKKR